MAASLNRLRLFLTHDRGQATTEYILLLAIVVGMFIVAIKNILLPAINALASKVSTLFEDRLFKKGGIHHLRIGK